MLRPGLQVETKTTWSKSMFMGNEKRLALLFSAAGVRGGVDRAVIQYEAFRHLMVSTRGSVMSSKLSRDMQDEA
jgi:hypothetical protein